MADEKLILDPSELAGSRTQFDLTPWIRNEGPDWDEGSVEAFRSTGEWGDQIIDSRYPNRQVTIPLMVQARGGTSFATVRSLIQAKAALYQTAGGWLKRITSTGGTLYADVQMASLKLSGGWLQSRKDADNEATLTLEVSPDFYGNEVTLADHVETSAAELVFTETAVSGDYPARVRMVVDEDQGQAQLGLIWGFRKRNYSSAATARLQYEAEALQPLDTAVRAALTGASGGTVVTHGTLSTNWTPVLGMNMAGTAYLTHVGSYRWWCRYRTTSGTAVQLRGVYDVGDLVLPEENPRWTHPGGTSFFIADFGQIRLDQMPVGTHRWAGMIQGKGDVGTENVSIDRVWFQPLDEGAGVLRAPSGVVEGLSAATARDGFNQVVSGGSDPLTGLTAPVGGVYTGAGDAVDFVVEDTGHTAQRTEVSDADENTGRYVLSGAANQTNVVAQLDVKRGSVIAASPGNVVQQGVLVRYTDTNNWLKLVFITTKTATGYGVIYTLELIKRVAGSVSTVARYMSTSPSVGAEYSTVRVQALSSGAYFGWWGATGTAGVGNLWLSGADTDLATGGALATGKVGLYDAWTGPVALTRTYDNFLSLAPTVDAVLYPSQSAELRWDGIVREDTGGTAYGPVSWVEGDLPRLPPTTEGGTVEVFLKASRGDFQSLPDTGIDDDSARITYRPCWLHPNS